MRITFISPNADYSGGIRVIAAYAQRLHERGHDVVVFSKCPDLPPFPRRVARWIKGRGWARPIPPGPSHFDGTDVDFRRVPSGRTLTERDLPDADAIIATWWQTAEWIERAPAAKGAKIFFVQGYEVFDWMPEDRVRRVWRLPFHKIVVAEWLRKLAHDEFGDHDVSLVPNSVDLRQFDVPEHDKPQEPTFGFIYSPARFRGCDTIVEALRLARLAVPQLRVKVFGSHPLSDALPLPPGADFVFTPAHDVIRGIYGSCTGWLFGSRQEGFGLPLLEAMACRTPVIATPGGAAPEILARGGGALVPHDDPRAMADAIVALAALAPEKWRALSQEAYSNACSYTWDDAVDRFESALARAIQKTRGADHEGVVRL
jgi:glycosyltransferase involved in cell wall biosynthesis